MSKTPFIRPLQVQGGTFYTFTSAAEDLSFTFNNSINKFKFSKFALLNIPNIDNNTNTQANFIRLNAPDSAFLDWATAAGQIITGNGNIDFSQSFQSYCLNLETTITSSADYDPTKKQNISERVFFKWLKEIGAMRWQPASSEQVSSSLDQNTVVIQDGLPITQKRFVEGDATAGTTGSFGLTGSYNRVVQYVGNLDIVNSVSNENNAYSEVYVYVPTNDGNTPYVLFKPVVDTNYYPETAYTNTPLDPLDAEYLYGRAYDSINPSGLTTLAIFDDDVLGAPTASYTNTGTGATSTGNWYSPRDTANTYFTDDLASFYTPWNKILTKSFNSQSLTYVRSNLDSIGIDFNPNSYQQIIEDPAISSIDEFNSTADARDFDFNAVLIYYDVYDPANPIDSATNLYGVLFLDDVNSDSGDTYIPRLKKYRPNVVTKLNGNSYGFKINLKFDTDIDQAGVEQAINDYSPFSLSMFMDAMNVLQDASSTLNASATQFINLSERVTNIEDVTLSTSTTVNLDARILALEEAYAANQALFRNTQSIVNLINQNYDLIRAVINNQTSVEVSYDLSLVKQGLGIQVDRSIPNQLIVNNINQDFNVGTNLGYGTLSQGGLNIIPLLNFSNYFKHVNNGNPITLTGDLNIRIDDSTINWKKGQRFRFSFGDRIYPGSYLINILTDASGKYPLSSPTGSPYSKLVISLDETTMASYDYLIVLDIVCVDDQNLIFQVDALGKSLTNNS